MTINTKKEYNFWCDEYPNATKRYRAKASSSKQRKIEFQFEFYDWYQWWLEQGIDQNRPIVNGSATANTPCMCRKNDTGPYHPSNVYLGTLSSNAKDNHNLPNQKTIA